MFSIVSSRIALERFSMIGSTISHYRIIDKLGHGGMGEVFLAEDTNLNRHVAIKVLPDVFCGDLERLARFEREAKLLASLSHQNIASIHGLECSRSSKGVGRSLPCRAWQHSPSVDVEGTGQLVFHDLA